MTRNIMLAGALLASAVGSFQAHARISFSLNEPVTVKGIPSVTLGPGTYVLRPLDTSAGINVVQILNGRQDYVYTTVMTIPATRPQPDDSRQFVFSETPSGVPPVLHFWFPPGEISGREFVNPPDSFAPQIDSSLKVLLPRPEVHSNIAGSAQHAADLYALREVLQRIESGKFSAARDCFRRNYFLAQSREGASTSFLLALLMVDGAEAKASFDLMNRLDPARARVMSRLDVYAVIQSLPSARRDLKGSLVRRFLLNYAMEKTEDPVARTAVIAFERHTLKGDSLPVEMALDRRREEIARKRRYEERWILANKQIARLNDCVKSLLSKVGALEYSASVGPVTLRVVLNRQRLDDLDAIMLVSHRSICDRHAKLERLISQRSAAVARALDSLRIALREMDRQPGSTTKSQYVCIRNWETARTAGVSHDLMVLAEASTSPLMRPSHVLRVDGYVQMNIAGLLAQLAEWIGQ